MVIKAYELEPGMTVDDGDGSEFVIEAVNDDTPYPGQILCWVKGDKLPVWFSTNEDVTVR